MPRRENKNERAKYINRRSFELANSGECAGWHNIEMKLRAEGYEEARQLLDNAVLRQELNHLCKLAQQRK